MVRPFVARLLPAVAAGLAPLLAMPAAAQTGGGPPTTVVTPGGGAGQRTTTGAPATEARPAPSAPMTGQPRAGGPNAAPSGGERMPGDSPGIAQRPTPDQSR